MHACDIRIQHYSIRLPVSFIVEVRVETKAFFHKIIVFNCIPADDITLSLCSNFNVSQGNDDIVKMNV